MSSLFLDGPEYTKRTKTPFKPPQVSFIKPDLMNFRLAELAVDHIHRNSFCYSRELHEKNTFKALGYVFRDVICAVVIYKLGGMIDTLAEYLIADCGLSSRVVPLVKWGLWSLYWFWQGIILAGWWCLAHEAGHGSLSNYTFVNHVVGFLLHTVSAG